MKKRRYLHYLFAERDKFERLLNQLGFSRLMTRAGVSGAWSVKDIVAHIMSYEQYTADRIAEIIHGESYIPAASYAALDAFVEKFGYPDFGSPLLETTSADDWIVKKYKNVPLEEVVAHEIQAFNAIIAGFETLSEHQLDEHDLFENITHNTSDHYRKHIYEIEHWRAGLTRKKLR